MTAGCATRAASAVGIVQRELHDLAARLDLELPASARVGADLAARSRRGVAWPTAAPLLRAADGWVHPGPPTAWSGFVDLAVALGAPLPAPGEQWPALDALTVEALDAEAAAWMLPAVAVRDAAASPDPVSTSSDTAVGDARVALLGTAWATPLVGHVLARLGARVDKVEHPRRFDPFPLHDDLVVGQHLVALDLDAPADRDRVAELVAAADLVVAGHPPRVLANAGIAPTCPVVALAALAADDRPGYGPAAEAHGGWAARHHPPRLARTSVADPVAGLVGALAAVRLLADGGSGEQVRVSLEGAVGRLLAREASGG
jgi:hypothetical protein